MWNIVKNLLIGVSSFFDGIIASLISTIYSLLMFVADTTVFNNDIMDVFKQRVYVIIGLFMLFRVAIAIIEYISDPEKLSNGKTSGSKMIVSVMFSLVMLVTYNYIFDIAYYFQTSVLKQNVLARIVFGVSSSSGTNVYDPEVMGKNMVFYIYTAFVNPNKEALNNSNICDGVYGMDSKSLTDCLNAIKLKDEDIALTFRSALESGEVKYLLDYDLLTVKSDKHRIFNYTPFVSVIAGIVILIMLLTYCVDIAIRSIKLAVLQLIAPIPIISYMIPGKTSEMLKKWASMCATSYANIFVKLVALYFAVFVIASIGNSGLYQVHSGDKITFADHPLVTILFIIGALFFAKKIPDLITDLTGIKMNGDFSLKDLKTGAGALLGLGAGVAGGMIGNAMASKAAGRGFGKSVFSALGGGLTGGIRGARAGFKTGGFGGLTSGFGAAGRGGQKIDAKQGTTFWGRNIASMQKSLGIETAADRQKRELDALNKATSAYDALEEKAKTEARKSDAYNQAAAKLEALKSTTLDKNNYMKDNFDEARFNEEYQNFENDIKFKVSQGYMSSVMAEHQIKDKKVELTAKYTTKEHDEEAYKNALKDHGKAIYDATTNLTNIEKAETEKWLNDKNNSGEVKMVEYVNAVSDAKAAGVKFDGVTDFNTGGASRVKETMKAAKSSYVKRSHDVKDQGFGHRRSESYKDTRIRKNAAYQKPSKNGGK